MVATDSQISKPSEILCNLFWISRTKSAFALLILVAEENRRFARKNYNNLIRDSLYSLFWGCNAINLYVDCICNVYV